MDNAASSGLFGVSHARVTAYAAVLLLCGAIAWSAVARPAVVASNQQTPEDTTKTDDTDYLAALASQAAGGTSEGVTPLGASIVTQAVMAYDQASSAASSSDAGIEAVKTLGANLKPAVDYRVYAAGDIKTVADTSKDRVLNYRADLRAALEPLLENKDYELDLFANYVDSKDPAQLAKIRAATQNYRLAIAATEKVVAPADAATYQAAILTAMSQFVAVLDALAGNATDPFASAALLRTFTEAQENMFASFNSIGKYSLQKML